MKLKGIGSFSRFLLLNIVVVVCAQSWAQDSRVSSLTLENSASAEDYAERKAPKNKDPEGRKAPAASYVEGYNATSFQTVLGANNCFTITSITSTTQRPATQMGTFSNGTAAGLSMDDGIILTTGTVAEAFTDNSSSGISQGSFNAGAINDPDLDALASNGLSTHDEAIIEIEFTIPSGIDGFNIPFQFASDEYPEYVCSIYNDVFAVFIDGPGLGGYQKISLVPGTNNPVSVNNLNGGSCGAWGSGEPSDLTQSAYYIDNNDGIPGGPIFAEYDGFTVALNAFQGGLTAGNYKLKLAIGDLGDGSWDSGVFFGAMEASSGGTMVNCSCIADPLADPLGDCDNDGTLNGDETDAAAALDPCDPDPLAIGTGDCDSDGTLNQDEASAAAALDPCDPDPLGNNLGDCDNDGTLNQNETDATAALDPCDPNPSAVPTADCDGDGVLNGDDACVSTPGLSPHGCPDFDNDGYPDIDDLDDDNDGILDLDECNWTNHALGGSASMISQWGSLAANRAIDNNTNGSNNNSLAHTGCGTANDWLDIDLGAVQQIDEVAVWNRTNCCSNRMSNVYLLISSTPFPTNSNLSEARANADFEFQFGNTNGLTRVAAGVLEQGRYVRLQKSGNNPGGNCLNILELQVFEYTPCDTDADGTDDSYDLDSDQDDCFDAIEGGASFTQGTDVDGSGALTGSVNNLGIPNLAGSSGQAVGSSQDASTLGADCSIEAVEDDFQVVKNNTTQLDVLANDISSSPTSSLTITILDPPNNGSVSIETSGSTQQLSFIPDNEFLGADTIVYQITTPGGLTSFDTVFISVFSPLPIDLISFDAFANEESGEVDLVWLTATEINNEMFVVFRSKDAFDWEVVNEQPGAGHSNQTLEYRATDENPLDGVSYYKLRQIDYDGQYEDSEIRAIEMSSKLELVIYPNPASGEFTIIDPEMVLNPHTVADQIKMYDTSGREVQMGISATQGRIGVTLPQGLSPGHYMLLVESESHIIHITR